MAYFDGIKVGDKVWSVEFGWGIVKDIQNNTIFKILVEFSDHSRFYSMEGKNSSDYAKNQTLFWGK